MSDDMNRIKDELKELYDSRNDHQTRLSIVETNIGHIREEQTQLHRKIDNYHDDTMIAVNDIKGVIESFRNDINGIPNQNKEDIEDLKVDVKTARDKIIFWGGGIALLGFIIIAFLAYKQAFPSKAEFKKINKETIKEAISEIKEENNKLD